MRKSIVVFAFVVAWIAAPLAAETIRIERPTLFPQTEETTKTVDAIFGQAAFLANRLYGEHIQVEYNGFGFQTDGVEQSADYTITVNAVSSEGTNVLVLTLMRARDGRMGDPFNSFAPWTPDLAGDVSETIYYIWASINDFEAFDFAEPPAFVGEFVPQGMQTFNVILGVETTPDGNVVLAGGTGLELDKNLRILGPAPSAPISQDEYSYAGNVGITPSGTLYFLSLSGDLYSLPEGFPRAQRIRTGVSTPIAFSVLRDGTAIIVNGTQRETVRIRDRRVEPIDIYSDEHSWIQVIADGPDGNLWVFDPVATRINVLTSRGEKVDSIIPLLPSEERFQVSAMATYENGDFLVMTPRSLNRFRRTGEPVWRMEAINDFGDDFTYVRDIEVDSQTGIIYLVTSVNSRLIKLVDTAYANEVGIDVSADLELAELYSRFARDTYDTDALSAMARIHEANGAFAVAESMWQEVTNVDPFSAEALDALDAIELNRLRSRATLLHEQTIRTLEEIGVESARQTYSQAVQAYEQILALSPDDSDSRVALQRLQQAFNQAEGTPGQRPRPLTVASVDLRNIFPSLMQYYRVNPAGTITVTNPFDEPIENVRTEFFVRKYMDFPAEGAAISRLAPGESAELPLTVILNGEVFSLEEDLLLQSQIVVRYEQNDEVNEFTRNQSVMLYKRTALSWDDSGKLAVFIMPNEETIARFARRVAEPGEAVSNFSISAKFFRAAKIADAVGTFGINYIEDPESPFTVVHGAAEFVDTVSFPRTTLLYRAGDCDDTTALLGSLYEAAGIRTAIMTSPGHVFLAFDTEEPEENSWMFEIEGLRTVTHNGTVWIPVETTILQEGFWRAWEEASLLLIRHQDAGEVEFLPVSDQRNDYPALPLPPATTEIVEPAAPLIASLFGQTIDAMSRGMYDARLASLQDEFESGLGRRRMAYLNRIGILHARFGRFDLAEETFRDAIEEDEDYVSSYINLANLLIDDNQLDEALAALENGYDKRPRSVLVNLLLTRVYYELGEPAEGAEYYELVSNRAPALAERYSYMVERDSTARASGADVSIPFIWPTEEE